MRIQEIQVYAEQYMDADRIMIQKDFITLSEGAEYYGLGMKPFTRIAREAGAVYKIGKMVRIRRDILEEYLRRTYAIDQDE